jgi:hypothetical protein
MPNDAKLGLVVGMTLVLLIAIFFFRPQPAPNQPEAAQAATAASPAMMTPREMRPAP